MKLPKLPAGACDAQIHVYGDAAKYPPKDRKVLYIPPTGEGTIEKALAMHARLGFDRLVITQATIFGTDHSLLVDTLNALPEDKARGCGIVDASVSDKELARMHDAGVRGARFNFLSRFDLVPDTADFHRQLARIGEMGWYAKLFCGPAELAQIEPDLRKAKATFLFDHLCQAPFADGVEGSGMKRILGLLKEPNFWMMLSNGDRNSAGHPWTDTRPFGRAFYDAAPDRCVWGSDWPHVWRWIRAQRDGYVEQAHDARDELLLDLGLSYLPDDRAVQQVFVDNPKRIFGF
jgi:2-pyrone-4,6-dicarboxylate lactonase